MCSAAAAAAAADAAAAGLSCTEAGRSAGPPGGWQEQSEGCSLGTGSAC